MKRTTLHQLYTFLLLFIFSFLSAGCIESVLYGSKASDKEQLVNTGVTTVYFDQEGSLYPSPEFDAPVDNQRFEHHKHNLQWYYQSNTKKEWAGQQKSELERLQKFYGLPSTPATGDRDKDNQAWQQLQEAMQNHFINRFRSRLSAENADELVVLIHGYNSKGEEATWFSELEREIRANYFQGKKAHFLEVRWDSRTAESPVRVWGYAQHTMYPVGLGLRRVLNSLNPEMPLYLFGHSSGAPLACVTLWNSIISQSSEPSVWGQYYSTLAAQPKYATPRPNKLRLALVAPAMSGQHFFNYGNRTPATLPAALADDAYERIIIAHNRNDLAAGKSFFPSNWFGSTSLGVRKNEFCDKVRPGIQKAGSNTEAFLLDFTGSMEQLNQKVAHGVPAFMQDKAKFKQLLDLWLTDTKAVEGTETCP